MKTYNIKLHWLKIFLNIVATQNSVHSDQKYRMPNAKIGLLPIHVKAEIPKIKMKTIILMLRIGMELVSRFDFHKTMMLIKQLQIFILS